VNTLGERIVFLREKRGISQKTLAEQLGITAASLSRYENNIYYPKGSIIISLSTLLHTSTDYLLGMTNNYQSKEETLSLTEKELNLLELYQTLSAEDKIRIDERILALHEIHNYVNNPNK